MQQIICYRSRTITIIFMLNGREGKLFIDITELKAGEIIALYLGTLRSRSENQSGFSRTRKRIEGFNWGGVHLSESVPKISN